MGKQSEAIQEAAYKFEVSHRYKDDLCHSKNVFSVSFTKKYLRRCIDPKLYDLPIKIGDGDTCIKARLTKGVDNRVTITRGWADFFPATNMKEREIYAFAFKRNHKRLRLTVHAL